MAGEAETGVGLEGESFRWLNFRPGRGQGTEHNEEMIDFFFWFCFVFTRGAAHLLAGGDVNRVAKREGLFLVAPGFWQKKAHSFLIGV